MSAKDAHLGAFSDAPERTLSATPGECRYVSVCGHDAPGANVLCNRCLALVRHNDAEDGLGIGDRAMLAHIERLYRHYGWFGGEARDV